MFFSCWCWTVKGWRGGLLSPCRGHVPYGAGGFGTGAVGGDADVAQKVIVQPFQMATPAPQSGKADHKTQGRKGAAQDR